MDDEGYLRYRSFFVNMNFAKVSHGTIEAVKLTILCPGQLYLNHIYLVLDLGK